MKYLGTFFKLSLSFVILASACESGDPTLFIGFLLIFFCYKSVFEKMSLSSWDDPEDAFIDDSYHRQ